MVVRVYKYFKYMMHSYTFLFQTATYLVVVKLLNRV